MEMRKHKAGLRVGALLMALLTGLFCLTGCGLGSTARYEYAQEYLAMGEYDAALSEFEALGEYEEAGKFSLYTSAIMAMEAGDFNRAQVDFENLGDFKNSNLYLQYAEARMLEEDENYEDAQSAYQALGSFKDSVKRMESCTATIPKMAYESAKSLMAIGEYEDALKAFEDLGSYSDSQRQAEACQQAILSKAYQEALGLTRGKKYAEALEAFVSLGSYRDSALQADTCRKILYQEAQTAEKGGNFAKVQEAIAIYESLEAYGDAAKKADELRARYAINLQLRGFKETYQYVALGTYPQNTASGKTPIVWRVLSVENGIALLLSEKILDVAPMDTAETFSGYSGSSLYGFLNGAFLSESFTTGELSALAADGSQGRVSLLSKEQVQNAALGFVDNAARESLGTEYSHAKGLHAATSGAGWWWLSTKGDDQNCQSLIYYSGAVYSPGLRASDEKTGVRPTIRLRLDSLFFTKGAGTVEDPYRQ